MLSRRLVMAVCVLVPNIFVLWSGGFGIDAAAFIDAALLASGIVEKTLFLFFLYIFNSYVRGSMQQREVLMLLFLQWLMMMKLLVLGVVVVVDDSGVARLMTIFI